MDDATTLLYSKISGFFFFFLFISLKFITGDFVLLITYLCNKLLIKNLEKHIFPDNMGYMMIVLATGNTSENKKKENNIVHSKAES